MSTNEKMVMVPRQWAQQTVSAGPGEYLSRSDIDLLIEALNQAGQQDQSVIVCDICHGAGEVYTGTMTDQGYHLPPEPDMDTCPGCSGEQRWYVARDIDRLVSELDTLLNGDGAARQATLGDIVAQVAAAQQGQGEPVGYVCGSALDAALNGRIGAESIAIRKEPSGYINKPLYTHADPAEVDRLRESERKNVAAADKWHERFVVAARMLDQLDRVPARLADAQALLREVSISPEWSLPVDLQVRISDHLSASAEPSAPLPPVDGDLLPPINSKVLIHLGREDKWVEHTVVGYYAWGNHGLDQNVHRVFVRVRDAEGYLNARLLSDVRPVDAAPPQL